MLLKETIKHTVYVNDEPYKSYKVKIKSGLFYNLTLLPVLDLHAVSNAYMKKEKI